VSGFSRGWLALREPYDGRARSGALARCLRRRLGPGAPRSLLDLGAGTGSNLRWLAPRLGGYQDWLLVDRDPDLLAAVPKALAAWAAREGHRILAGGGETGVEGRGFVARVRTLRLDMAAEADRLPLVPAGVVTASALLDLVSADWLADLARRCADRGCPLLFALTYDGRFALDPSDPGDEEVRTLVNHHQRGDKGFGAALGPTAAAAAANTLRALGYRVWTRPSDWRAGPADRDLQCALTEGWASAALELAQEAEGPIGGWLRRRRELLHAGGSSTLVGHLDLLALPPG
jgi:SAM-dependent methyltransferase